MTENSLFSKHLTTIIWQMKHGEVKHCTTFFILNQRPLRVILVTNNNLEMKAGLHGRESRTRCWQLGARVHVACSASPQPHGRPQTQREKGKRGRGLFRPCGPRSQRGVCSPSAPIPTRGRAGPWEALLTSSAKTMLVRREGWDRRACTTAFREHCCSPRPSGSMLATSGRVDDLWREEENSPSGATGGEAGLGPGARAAAPICPRLAGRRGQAPPASNPEETGGRGPSSRSRTS